MSTQISQLPNPENTAGQEGEAVGAAGVSKVRELQSRIQAAINKAQEELESFTKNDRSYRRKDTVEVVKDVMRRIKEATSEINQQSEEIREKLYYLIYNSTILIFRACHQLRAANFSREATHYLAFNVLCLDNNLILTTTKYLDWRVLNYVELARAYADVGALKAATKVISYGISKVLYTKQVEEQDPPVPEGTKDTLIDALRVLRTQELKYELQSTALSPEAWRKKLEETFSNNKYHRSLAIVECLQTNEPFSTSAKASGTTKAGQLMADALKQVVDLVKPDVELVKQALVQVHEKKKRDREKKEKLQNRDPEVDLDELLDKYKQMDAEMIAEKDWKYAAANVPIEIHVELVKKAFESQMWNEFDALLDPALVRLKFRRYEVPYLATIDVLMSANKVANIPNGFEKLPRDLNQANLRIELKRLRASAKKGGAAAAPSGAASTKQSKDGAAPPKEEAKKEDPKKAPPAKDAKGKKGEKVAASNAAEDESKSANDDEIQASEHELEAIKHVYVHMLLQRTKNPQNAIVGVDVVLADENLGPALPDNHFAVAVPIRQHAGSYEKAGVIPYVVFRRTANSLIDEEDSLSILTDVCVIQGQDPHLRAPLGYNKIALDLRQTPEDLERVPNLDYVFVCYKTDKQLALAERDLLILRRLAELEKSFIPEKSDDHKALDEARQYLGLNFSQDLLVELSGTVREALLGPLGDYYLENRLDMLTEISGLLWSKYLLPVLQKVDIYIEMRGQKEYFGEFVDSIDEAVIRIRRDFVETFNVMHRILTRMDFVPDMVMYCKFSIYLASLQEEVGEFRNAVQALRSALGKVVEFREERMKRTLDSDAPENASTAMSITIDNKKIGDLELKMETIYKTWEEIILRKERDRVRRETSETPLDEDEGDEEQLEVQQCLDELRDKGLFEREIDVAEWHKEHKARHSLSDKKFFSETDQIIHAMHGDILMNLYRCEIKLGKEMNVVKRQTTDLLKTQGIDLSKNAPGNLTKNLSVKLQTKMNMAKGKTLAQNKGALKNLQQTLQEAGKLPPAKPQILSFEKILERENNQNPYQNALLYMSLAMAKSNNVEQKSLLLESLEFLKKARLGEDTQSEKALENTVYLRAARHYHEYFGRSADQVHPFGLLAKPQYIKKTPVPAKPVMVCRTSTSITMKLPFYKPLTEYKAWRNIANVALYGKPSGSGVAVSLNNIDYDGTGEKRAPGSVLNVTGLIPNERYVFAAGGYTADDTCVNGIGETSNEILTLLPLSLHQLYGYLAEIAFKLQHFHIAQQAAEQFCQQFLIKNEFNYAHLDTQVNPILAFRLDEDYLSRVSMVEAKQLAEAFIILAKVSKIVRNDVQRRADTCELQVEKQKVDMKIANFLCLALEISTSLNRPSLTKRVVAELYNHLVGYFTMKMRPQILLQVLLKCHQSLRLVPAELIDANCRRILGCLSYQVIKLGFETSEDSMLRRAMISELPIASRRWRRYSQYVLNRPRLTEEESEKKDEQEKRIELGEEIPEEELIKEPEPYEERLYKLDEFEEEGQALEEFLLSLMEYQDVVKAKTEKWKEAIQTMQDVISGGEEVVAQKKEQLMAKVEFWEQVKTNKPSAQLAALVQAHDAGAENPRYLEFCCKCIRRAMESGDFSSFEELGRQIRDGVQVTEEDEAAIESRINERIEYLDKDIVRKQRKRFAALEEKVKQMLEEQSLSGGNTGFGTKKLKQLVSGDKTINDDDNNNLIVFDSDEQAEQKQYNYLWISEKQFLSGICQFLELVATSSQRSQLDAAVQSCVFNDILQIDFIKFKQILEEHNEDQKSKRTQFEEEHKEDEEVYTLEAEARVQKVSDLLQVMARAAEYAKNSRSWLQLVAIIRYTWNVFAFDLTNPLELTQVDGWHYILLIAECSLCLVEHLQKGGSLRKMAGREIDEIKDQKPTFDKEFQTKTSAVKFEAGTIGVDVESQTGADQVETKAVKAATNGKGTKWFETIEEFEISLHASLIGYTVQCLMAVSKWESLVDISNRLNTATNNEFASQLLPFSIYAQTTLYNQAAAKTSDKRKALEVRIQAFENWKLTSKKKRSRTAMLTGEIPPEEQEFLRDKQQLEKEIFRLDVIENVLFSDKQASDGLLENIKRDANNCVESLKQCRKLYHQYGIETQNLCNEEIKKGPSHFEIRSKRKGHKVFTTMVISNYKKCIELLRKRQEKFLLIQALHELGNLLYADNNLTEAEICWNDCVDTIFQRLYVVNQFREVFDANPSLADAFGSQQVLIGGIVLTKLAKLCYEGTDLNKHSECILMAAELFAAPSKLSLPHPQVATEHATYTFREFMGRDLFTDKHVLQPSELLHTIGVATQQLIDQGLFDKALPLAALMEFIACDITRSKVLTVKARLLKATSLVELGYLNEALQIYKRTIHMKDLPDYGARQSEHSTKTNGKNFQFPASQVYRNDLSPEADENQAVIKLLLEAIPEETEKKLKAFCSPYIVESLHFLRAQFMTRIGETENVESSDKAELRMQLLKAAEDVLRTSLKRLQLAEEVQHIQSELGKLKAREINTDEEGMERYAVELKATFERANVQEEAKAYYSNSEEEMCFADTRSQRLALMLRTRACLGRIFMSQGLLLESFYILRQGLINFKALAEGQYREVENGAEAENKGSFKLPDQISGAGAPAVAGKKAAPPAKEVKPVKGGANVADDTETKRLEEGRRKQAGKEAAKLKAVVETLEKRQHPHLGLWLSTKLCIIKILLAQKRYEDCTDAIAVTRLEAQSVKDQLFVRKLKEVEFQIFVQSGDLREAMLMAKDIRKHAAKYHQTDGSFCDFLGNLSELMYNQNKDVEAVKVVEEARRMTWDRLGHYGLQLDQQNINGKNDVKVWDDRKTATEEELEARLAHIPQAAAATGKNAAPAKGAKAAPAKGAAVDEPEVAPETVSLDFSKPIEYKLSLADRVANSSSLPPNLYLKSLEALIRFDLRYAQYLTTLEQRHEAAKSVLVDTAKLVARCLFVTPQLKFYQRFLQGHVNLAIFYDKVIDFQSKYMKNPRYKDSFVKHVPYSSIALGHFLIELPNFSEKLRAEFRLCLNTSEQAYSEAIGIARTEAVVYEFDFSVIDALRGMAEVCFIQSEYRMRTLEYKYADFEQKDYARRLERLRQKKKEEADAAAENDDLEDGTLQQELKDNGDKWEEQKREKEILEVHNYRMKSVKYLEAVVTTSACRKDFGDKQHELEQAALTDLSKIPKEVISELFEASQVSKVISSKQPDFEFKDKTSVSAGEILAYTKAVVNECGMLTFGEEKTRLAKLISKLHRYLLANLAPYNQRCNFTIPDVQQAAAVSSVIGKEITSTGHVVCHWFDQEGKDKSRSSMFYILGPLDAAATKAKLGTPEIEEPTKEQREQIASDAYENALVHFGKVEADALELSQLYQDTRDLIDKMRTSAGFSEERNQRDRKGYGATYHDLILRLGNIFKPPILSEEELENDVDCLALVKDLIPELSVEGVEKLASVIQKATGSSYTDPLMNAILRAFHRVRYVA